ncbi:hypothetical protein CHLRE_12g524650v5 [Chlamydomonas reinhardtii]|uniref:NAD-dependent protein deacylase n=1 Tax=Chlamydomonas reinhardtii TaxID=3055 RepID=D9IPD0_CHLRE|nr:uncharacterized protein CHLRE_12g524650v5 [Chlamydomonas reinhardtii]ADK11042.1 Sir2-like protein [Chlamydomonas reinhardtii]PNW75376.1 hypothetical protein CHLRE_12g524650v5 [Chlamydomonas reinhardtii]
MEMLHRCFRVRANAGLPAQRGWQAVGPALHARSSPGQGDVCPGAAAALRGVAASALAAAAAPAAPPADARALDELADIIHGSSRLVVLTGAGCSTESGVPDYRSPQGAYSTGFKPMTHQQFLASPANRARYWARSFYGWPRFSATQPNSAHVALAELEQRGWVQGLITQNVDRLHTAAGSRNVIELHGSSHDVICLGCGRRSSRHAVQAQLAALNPAAAAHVAQLAAAPPDVRREREQALRVGTSGDAFRVAVAPATSASSGAGSSSGAGGVGLQRPDGDVELADAGVGFTLATCSGCGDGPLKPDVVFFGDNIPPERKDRAADLAGGCDALLVVGSSVQVYSAFRLVEAARGAGARVLIVNVGPTRADKLADFKLEARAGEVLTRLSRHPQLLLPRLS